MVSRLAVFRVFSMFSALTACAEDPITFEQLIEKERSQIDEPIADCGRFDDNWECAKQLSEAQTCFIAAAEECRASEMRIQYHTDEGDPIVSVFVVTPQDDYCKITTLTDHSADEFKGDYGDFIKRVCDAVSGQAYDEQTGACATTIFEGCETVEEWYE